ncbi:hypothetical protein O3P69_006787 [Scylla paramamosain]|uniref:Uncharacterized protein n=1 Tax=Scylla paramamosain TaxID=85552 RepID=A0AAW0U455_SCYPA
MMVRGDSGEAVLKDEVTERREGSRSPWIRLRASAFRFSKYRFAREKMSAGDFPTLCCLFRLEEKCCEEGGDWAKGYCEYGEKGMTLAFDTQKGELHYWRGHYCARNPAHHIRRGQQARAGIG